MCYKIFPENFDKVVLQPRSKKELQEKAAKFKPAPPKPKPVVEKPTPPPAPKPAPKKEEPPKEPAKEAVKPSTPSKGKAEKAGLVIP